MLKNVIIAVIFLVMNIIVVSGAYLTRMKLGAPVQAIHAQMPDFSWKDEAGAVHSIKELSGRPIIIHFWATWCGPCRRELPDLLRKMKTLDGKVTLLAISGDDRREDMNKFIVKAEEEADTKDPKNVIFAFDPDKKISFDVFQSNVYPESILVGSDGMMQRKFAGAANWSSEQVNTYLTQFLSASPPVGK